MCSDPSQGNTCLNTVDVETLHNTTVFNGILVIFFAVMCHLNPGNLHAIL